MPQVPRPRPASLVLACLVPIGAKNPNLAMPYPPGLIAPQIN
jgi:hypothetical protein